MIFDDVALSLLLSRLDAVAEVPIHPRSGPLWANVRAIGADTPMPSYPLMPLYGPGLAWALAEARAELEAITALLPGPYYMDPPDGGDVTVLEQLRRMAKDAARYRFLQERFMEAKTSAAERIISDLGLTGDAWETLDVLVDRTTEGAK